MKEVLTQMKRSTQSQAAYFTGSQNLHQEQKKRAQMKINKRYQGYAKALSKAGLDPKIYPTLKEIWKKADASK